LPFATLRSRLFSPTCLLQRQRCATTCTSTFFLPLSTCVRHSSALLLACPHLRPGPFIYVCCGVTMPAGPARRVPVTPSSCSLCFARRTVGLVCMVRLWCYRGALPVRCARATFPLRSFRSPTVVVFHGRPWLRDGSPCRQALRFALRHLFKAFRLKNTPGTPILRLPFRL